MMSATKGRRESVNFNNKKYDKEEEGRGGDSKL